MPLLTRVQQGHTHLRLGDLREVAVVIDQSYRAEANELIKKTLYLLGNVFYTRPRWT